jgi:hypothetical protein
MWLVHLGEVADDEGKGQVRLLSCLALVLNVFADWWLFFREGGVRLEGIRASQFDF